MKRNQKIWKLRKNLRLLFTPIPNIKTVTATNNELSKSYDQPWPFGDCCECNLFVYLFLGASIQISFLNDEYIEYT